MPLLIARTENTLNIPISLSVFRVPLNIKRTLSAKFDLNSAGRLTFKNGLLVKKMGQSLQGKVPKVSKGAWIDNLKIKKKTSLGPLIFDISISNVKKSGYTI